jgi:Fe-Mn family superoxide dismutase
MENIIKEIKLVENKILTEQLRLEKRELLSEMKKIGIEKLPYAYASLNRFIDAKTMDIHYNKHYKGYVKKLNAALRQRKGADATLEEIVKSIGKYSKAIRNNAGGAFNHAMFWQMLSPKKQTPNGDVYNKIIKDFGSFKQFKKEFEQCAMDRFGSGWAWLVLTPNNRLKIMSTANQDNPLMNVVDGGGFPLLGLDLWEHAYYLKYQNKRDEYIRGFWDCVNWDFVNELYNARTKK